MNIKITADRMIDLPREELESLGISTMPCYINMGDKSYSDLDDVFPEDVFDFVKSTGKMAKTAAKSPEDYYEFFLPFVKSGNDLIHFACSSGISSICEHSKIAAQRLEDEKVGGRVFVIDTLALSNAIAILAKYAIGLISGGETSPERIVALCTELMPRVNCSFLIDDLVFLHKGGRCSTLAFYAANLLRIKPVVFMDDKGRMTVREKVKGSKEKALKAYIKNSFEKKPPESSDIYFVLTSKDDDMKDLLKSILSQSEYNFDNIIFNTGSCNCCVHSGRNAVGMFYLNK